VKNVLVLVNRPGVKVFLAVTVAGKKVWLLVNKEGFNTRLTLGAKNVCVLVNNAGVKVIAPRFTVGVKKVCELVNKLGVSILFFNGGLLIQGWIGYDRPNLATVNYRR